jgi:hypothetical protein
MINTVADALTTSAEWLLLGDPAYQYPLAAAGALPAVVTPLPAGTRHSEVRYASAYLRGAEATTSSAVIVRSPHELAYQHLGQTVPAWDSGYFQTPLIDALAEGSGTAGVVTALRTAAPLAVLRLIQLQDQVHVEILTCARVRAVGVLFARAAELTASPADSMASLVCRAFDRCSDLNDRIAGEWMAYTTHEAGTEIELKFTLTGSRTPWELAAHFAHRTASGALTDFIPDIGNELQRWHFHQHTFEITAPPEARGYLAFMPDPNGTQLIKRKTFAQDGLRRHEDFRNHVPIADDLAAFVDREYPDLTTRRLRSFNRTRFDVNLESTRTGDCFGIEIDEVVLPETGAVLRQAEIEYHRTRVHLGMTPATLEPELARLAEIVGLELAALGEPAEQSYYSKLTFLRQQEEVAAERLGAPVGEVR